MDAAVMAVAKRTEAFGGARPARVDPEKGKPNAVDRKRAEPLTNQTVDTLEMLA